MMKYIIVCPHCEGGIECRVEHDFTIGLPKEELIVPLRTIVVYQSTNRKGRKDATGAFKPEAFAFQEMHKIHSRNMIPIPHSLAPAKRARKVLELLDCRIARSIDCFAYFGHGTQKSFPSMGFGRGLYGDRDVRKLSEELGRVGRPNLVVVLYACLTGKGFGVADWLGDELREQHNMPKARVIAHLGKGHTTKYPFVEYSGEGAGDLGVPIITKSDPLWSKWYHRLQNDQSFRLSLPFLSTQDIRKMLSEGG